MKHLLIGALVGLAAASSAQGQLVPHILTQSGVIFDVGYEFEMGQPTLETSAAGKLKVTKGCVKATASQNSQSLRFAAAAISNPGPFDPRKWTVHRCPKGGGGGGAGGILSFSLTGLTALELPALDVDAKEAAYFELEFGMQDVHFDGFAAPSTEEKNTIKGTQKAWLPSNFRIKIGNLPAGNCRKAELRSIRGRINAAGGFAYTIDEPIVCIMPVEDSAGYLDWYQKVAAGGTDIRPMTIEYDDDDGLPVLTVTVDVEITSAYFEDVLGGTDSTSGRDFRVSFRAVNNPGVK